MDNGAGFKLGGKAIRWLVTQLYACLPLPMAFVKKRHQGKRRMHCPNRLEDSNTLLNMEGQQLLKNDLALQSLALQDRIMIDSGPAPFPLEGVTETQLRKLCQVLWEWPACIGCTTGQPCAISQCPWQRWTKLEPFFQYYREVTSFYVPELLPRSPPALRGHEDIFDIIQLLKDKPKVPRSQLTNDYFFNRDGGRGTTPPLIDQNRAFNLAVRIMTMVNCSIESQPSGLLEFASQPVPWRSDRSLTEFLTSTFPTRDHPSLNETEGSRSPDIKSVLTAERLQNIAGLRFKATDDLKNHLKLNQNNGIVEIYHHTSVLKEHLIATKESGRTQSLADSIST
jgi:hypothetical protein